MLQNNRMSERLAVISLTADNPLIAIRSAVPSSQSADPQSPAPADGLADSSLSLPSQASEGTPTSASDEVINDQALADLVAQAADFKDVHDQRLKEESAQETTGPDIPVLAQALIQQRYST